MLIVSKNLPKNRFKPKISKSSHKEIEQCERYITECFRDLMGSDIFIRNIFDSLFNDGFEGVIFGGWVRDRIIELHTGRKIKSKDIDFVCKGAKPLSEYIQGKKLVRENMFGGYFIDYPTMHIDIWELDKTYLVQKNKLDKNFKSLLLTADYTTNAVIYFPEQKNSKSFLFENGCITSIKRKELDFLADEIAFPLVQAARAVIFSSRFGFTLSNTIIEFIQDVCKSDNEIRTVRKGIDDFCHEDFKPNAKKIFKKIIEKK